MTIYKKIKHVFLMFAEDRRTELLDEGLHLNNVTKAHDTWEAGLAASNMGEIDLRASEDKEQFERDFARAASMSDQEILEEILLDANALAGWTE